jgi:hypothetical protein
MPIAKVTACLSLIACAVIAGAQASLPANYTVVEAGAVPGGQTTVYRSGSKALILTLMPAEGATPANKNYSLYDLAAGKNWTWNPDEKPIQCGAGTFQGDWGDPFAMTAEVDADIAKGQLKSAGMATMDGLSTEVYTGSQSGATERVWLDKKDGLVVRAVVSMPGAQPMTMANVTKVTLAPPPMSLLSLPPSCAGVKAPPTPAELIAEETGDSGANYVSAFNGPGSANNCQVTMRVVDARTMMPVSHIQVAIDTAYKQDNPPHYETGVHNDGTVSFSGGGIREITNTVHNSVVTLGSLPPYFMLDVNLIRPGHGDGMGLVYRQCFAPKQVLLYVVRDHGKSTESVDALWVKSGKYAATPSD